MSTKSFKRKALILFGIIIASFILMLFGGLIQNIYILCLNGFLLIATLLIIVLEDLTSHIKKTDD